jgi:pimeloyl-ACP methyl ester carboxylesterase
MATFQTADGLTLHYTDEGHGPAILCLSGLTRNASDFDYVTPHLHDARLIKLDSGAYVACHGVEEKRI